MSSQLVSYNFYLNSSINSVSNTILYMTVFFVFLVCFIENGIMKYIGEWLDMSFFKMAVLKTVPVKEFVRIWSIALVVFRVTLVGLFIVGIIPFQ